MKTFNTELWKQNLNEIYQQAMTSASAKPFFIAVYEYVDYVMSTSTLAELSNIFYVYQKTDYEALEEHKEQLIAYIKGITPNLDKIKSDHGEIKEEVRHIKGILAGHTQVMGDREGWGSIFNGLDHIANVAVREETSAKEILPLLGVEKWADRHILKWTGYDAYEKYRVAKEQTERLQEARGWYAWQHLKLFYEIYKDHEGMKKDVAKNNNTWDSINMVYLVDELKAVLKDVTTDQMRVFRQEKYRPFMQRAHRQLISEIGNFEVTAEEMIQEEAKQEPTQTIPYIFDEQAATVEIDGKTVQFQKETRKFELLKKLIDQPEGVYYADAAAELEGALEKGDKSVKDTYYNTCRGIQTSFLKAGITDFLDFNYTKAQIKPVYKNQVKVH